MWPNFATVITIIRHQHKFFFFFFKYISSRLFPPAFFRATLSSCLCSPWTHRQQTHGDPRTIPHYEKCVYCTTMRPKQKSASDASDVCSHLTLAQKLLHREVLTQGNFCTQWDICAQKPLQRGAVLRPHVYTQTLSHTQPLHTEAFTLHTAFTKRSFYTHTQAFTQRGFPHKCFTQRSFCLHTETFTQKNFYTQKLLHRGVFTHWSFCTRRSFHTKKSLHRGAFNAFAHRSFCAEKSLHRGAFTHRSFYTEKSLHRGAFTHGSFWTEKSLHKGAYTHKNLCTQKLLPTEAFTYRSFYLQKVFAHRSFYTEKSLHREVFSQRGFCTQKLLRREVLDRRPFAQTRLHTEALTHGRLCTKNGLDIVLFFTRKLWSFCTENPCHRVASVFHVRPSYAAGQTIRISPHVCASGTQDCTNFVGEMQTMM